MSMSSLDFILQCPSSTVALSFTVLCSDYDIAITNNSVESLLFVVEIIVFKGTVIHKQNGVVVVEYHLWTPEWDEMIAGSKFPSYNENWAKVAPKGYIGLQDHGDDVWFKDIKIKEL